LKKYLLKNWWRYLIGGINLLGSTAIDILVPFITMSIVDDVIIGRDMMIFKRDMILLASAAGGRAICQYVKEYLCDMAGCNVAEAMRKDLMKHLSGLSKSFFDRNNTGELMARVKDDTGSVWDLTGFVGMLMTEATCYFFGVIVCMVKLNWKLSIIPIAFMPYLAYKVLKLNKQLGKTYGEISDANSVLTRVAEENISGVRTVKAFSTEAYELSKFDEKNKAYCDLNIEQAKLMAKEEPVIQAVPRIMQVIVIAVGGYAAIKGNITYGVLVAFMQYSACIVWPIENLGWMLALISQGVAGYKKIKKIMDEKPEISESENAELLDNTGELRFDHVSFNVNNHDILSDVSFTLAKGKTLGIMGATGAGKSTIVNLIERFYDTTDGSVMIDGIDIKQMPLNRVRGFSSVVTQDVFLFSDTIKDNVRLGQKKIIGEAEIKSAIKKAHADEFVEKITDQYDTVIGERGIGLSGGQKQRLSIARALARPADVLILDDSTSALDMETEADIQKELSRKTDTSKIIIGHRISSVKDADEIIVLDKGRVAERGSHAELIAKKGLYFETYEAQYGDYRNALRIAQEEGGDAACQ